MFQKYVKAWTDFKCSMSNKKSMMAFTHACGKLKRKHNKLNTVRIRIVRTYLRHLEKIGLPTTQEEKVLIVKMLQMYDETLDELRAEVNRFRMYVSE